MASGSIQNVIVCVPASTGASTAPCTTLNGVKHKPVMQSAYLIAPSSAGLLDIALEPIEKSSVSAVFSAAFSLVLFFFLVARGIGLVLNLIRKG